MIENDSASLKPFINKINVTYNNASAVITKLKNERFAEKPDNALIHQYKMQLSNIIKNPIIDYFEVEYENAFFGNDYAAKFIFNQLRISDTSPLDSGKIVGLKLVRVGLDNTGQNIPIGMLAIQEGATLNGTFDILKPFDTKSEFLYNGNIQNVINLVNTHMNNVLTCESEIINESKMNEKNQVAYNVWFDNFEQLLTHTENENEMLIRLGSSKSILYQTMLPAIYLFDKDAFSKLRLLLDLGNTTILDFPSTISLVNNSYQSLGFVKVKLS